MSSRKKFFLGRSRNIDCSIEGDVAVDLIRLHEVFPGAEPGFVQNTVYPFAEWIERRVGRKNFCRAEKLLCAGSACRWSIH